MAVLLAPSRGSVPHAPAPHAPAPHAPAPHAPAPHASTRRASGSQSAGSRSTALGLLTQARTVLAEAERADEAGERFRLAHLSALRTAAAVAAQRGRPASSRRRLMSVWVLLEKVAPEYAEWAAFFAAGAQVRAAVEAGSWTAVNPRTADDQVRAARDFLALVEGTLGMLAA